jgi:peptide-methionine (S)-S-oxide reductase
MPEYMINESLELGVAVLAGGCFWCTEAVFKQLKGVSAIQPGYAGGHPERANYKAVCTGVSGHAEVIKIDYDPKLISYGRLLQVFFAVAHDATQLNRQGNDVGTQYRSAIFPVDEHQHHCALAYKDQLTKANIFIDPIETSIELGQTFYSAESYHHNYAEMNPDQSYIRAVSAPKAEKLSIYFQEFLSK